MVASCGDKGQMFFSDETIGIYLLLSPFNFLYLLKFAPFISIKLNHFSHHFAQGTQCFTDVLLHRVGTDAEAFGHLAVGLLVPVT